MREARDSSPCAPAGASAGGAPRIRRSRATRWRATALIGVHLLVAIHIAHWWTTGSTMTPLEPSEAMEFSKHSIVNAGLVFFSLLILSTLVLGRFACGWGCHLVALQDLSRALLLKIGIRPRPLRSRALLLVPAVAAVYMFLWPVAYRLWIRDSFAIRGTEFSTNEFWRTFPGAGIALLTFAVCGFVIVYFLGAKGFCTYACPYGAIFGVADRLAPGRIRVTDACEGCGHCTQTCTSNVQVAREVRDYGMVVDPGCMKCLDCVSVCPKGALYFGFGRPSLRARPRREPAPHRWPYALWEEALLAFLFVLALVTFRGLYDSVPFLLSLGTSAIVAFAFFLLVRVLRRQNVQLQRWTLASGGHITRTGAFFTAGCAAFGLFWVHSGLVQYHLARAEGALERLGGPRASWFTERRPLDEREEELATALGDHARFVERWGLATSHANDVALAWAGAFAGEDEVFVRHLGNALARTPGDAHMWLELGHAERSRGRVDEAARAYRRALDADPGMVAASSALAMIEIERGDIGTALEVLAGATATVPSSASLWHDLGVARAVAGDGDGASAAFERALELAPERLEVRGKLASLLIARGEVERGLEVLREGVRRAPEAWDTHAVLAEAALSLGRLDEAEAALEQAHELAPERPEPEWLRAGVLEVRGEPAAAAEARGRARAAQQALEGGGRAKIP